MSHWWRAYDEAVDDPKLLLLSDRAHRAWFNLMCLASIGGGRLPERKVIELKLRLSAAKTQAVLNELTKAVLIDEDDDGLAPHNWKGRQYKSDVTDPTAATRMQRYRNNKRNDDRNDAVTVTPPRVQTTETDSESKKDCADAPLDVRGELFQRGLSSLASMTGKTPSSCRSIVGKWLKACNDEAIHVLAAIDDAATDRVVDPVAWIEMRLRPRSTQGKSYGSAAPNRLAVALQGLKNHVGDLDRSQEGGEPPPRLLSNG